jgi:hypothetical protein
MTDLDQCIICLEALPPPPSLQPKFAGAGAAGPVPEVAPPTTTTTTPSDDEDLGEINGVASLNGCGHVLHDSCLRSWTQKTNTCPICRTPFQEVKVFDAVDGKHSSPLVPWIHVRLMLTPKPAGNELSRYFVEDKKQVAEFDLREWLEQNPEGDDESAEDHTEPCPVCNQAHNEDVLLLCDGCDAAYHTYCLGLDSVPEGHWYCMECQEVFDQPVTNNLADEVEIISERPLHRSRPTTRTHIFPRTRQRARRAQIQARSVAWEGAWGQLAGRVYDVIGVDLDNDEDDESLEDYRRSQRQRDREHREYQRWQQRISIANRLGAGAVFANNIPRALATTVQRPQPTRQTEEEAQAWSALESARNDGGPSATGASRRRKERHEPDEVEGPAQEPERPRKRPRTRRVQVYDGAPASSDTNGPNQEERPSFLSSLLKEVENFIPSDEDNARSPFRYTGGGEAASPVTSPSPSSHNSPRAITITPPPMPSIANGRQSPLSSYVEPRYQRPPQSLSRGSPETSDSERRPKEKAAAQSEIRQPRPQRRVIVSSAALARSPEVSPVRPALPLEAKQSINSIVRAALKPHWRAAELTSEQYENINRDVSRKLYEEVTDPSALNDDARRSWEKIATREVSRAVQELKA